MLLVERSIGKRWACVRETAWAFWRRMAAPWDSCRPPTSFSFRAKSRPISAMCITGRTAKTHSLSGCDSRIGKWATSRMEYPTKCGPAASPSRAANWLTSRSTMHPPRNHAAHARLFLSEPEREPCHAGRRDGIHARRRLQALTGLQGDGQPFPFPPERATHRRALHGRGTHVAFGFPRPRRQSRHPGGLPFRLPCHRHRQGSAGRTEGLFRGLRTLLGPRPAADSRRRARCEFRRTLYVRVSAAGLLHAREGTGDGSGGAAFPGDAATVWQGLSHHQRWERTGAAESLS